jgi:hypothetical protein
MKEQPDLPFLKDLKEKELIGRSLNGRDLTEKENEEYEREIVAKEGKPTSEEKSRQAAQKALDAILERKKEDKEKSENQ